jgi:hypothetical protein
MQFSFKSILLSFLCLICIAGNGLAADGDFELNINTSDVEALFNVRPQPREIPLGIGGGFLYSEDDEDYWIVNADVTVVDEVFAPALELGVGLQGLFGQVDFPARDFDIAALPFKFVAGYDLRKTAINWPVSFLTHLEYAPSILSFSDTDDYLRFTLNGYFHINYFAAVFIGYRNLSIDFEDGSVSEELSDAAGYLGIRLSF